MTKKLPTVYIPLAIIVLVMMVKDFFEDYKRKKQDELENKSITYKLKRNI